MTATYSTGGYGRGGSSSLSIYYRKRDELSEIFSRSLTAGERFEVLSQEAGPLIVGSFGYLACVVGLRLLTGIAFAQVHERSAFGFTLYEWSVLIYLIYNIVVLFILGLLVLMIVRGSKSQWVWRTASFLLGFLVKSIAAFPAQ